MFHMYERQEAITLLPKKQQSLHQNLAVHKKTTLYHFYASATSKLLIERHELTSSLRNIIWRTDRTFLLQNQVIVSGFLTIHRRCSGLSKESLGPH